MLRSSKTQVVCSVIDSSIQYDLPILGSHQDTYMDSPGAVDNGSGVAIMNYLRTPVDPAVGTR